MLVNLYAVKKVKLVNNRFIEKAHSRKRQVKVLLMKCNFLKKLSLVERSLFYIPIAVEKQHNKKRGDNCDYKTR